MSKPASPAMLLEIQNHITGKRNDPLTPVEVNKLFSENISPELNLILITALQRGKIDPNLALIQIISKFSSSDYLTPLAITLRYGANPNMYVNSPKIGIIHILGYIYNTLVGDPGNPDEQVVDTPVLNTIILMMILMGSKAVMPMFDRSAGIINQEPLLNTITVQGESVKDWLNSHGYSGEVNIFNTIDSEIMINGNYDNVITDKNQTVLAAFLDRKQLIKGTVSEDIIELAIKNHSNTILKDILPKNLMNVTSDYGMDSRYVVESINKLNQEAFTLLMNSDVKLSYVAVDRLISKLNLYNSTNLVIPRDVIDSMLMEAVTKGIVIDKEQLAIITPINADMANKILKDYQKPYWVKICNSRRGTSPLKLKRLAFALNIDVTLHKETICNKLSAIAKTDKNEAKKAAIERQRKRISLDLGYVEEFIKNEPDLSCRNKTLLLKDPYEYNDACLAAYRDEQGAVWCFTCDMFATSINSGLNPYNGNKLPSTFVDKLRYKLVSLQKLGRVVDIMNPLTFSDGLTELERPDSVTDNYSNEAVTELYEEAMKYNVSSDTIKGLTPTQLGEALRSANIDFDFRDYSNNHALITFAHIVDFMKTRDSSRNQTIFDTIKEMK